MLKNSPAKARDRSCLTAQHWWFGRRLAAPAEARVDEGVPRLKTQAPQLRVGTRCVRGNYRTSNEDKCFADATHGVFLVADGMGGYEGGAEASRTVLQVLPSHLRTVLEAPDFSREELQAALLEGMRDARKKMLLHAETHPGCHHMGATMALAIVREHVAYVARVGDCRVYLVRGDKVLRLTSDETFAQELKNVGAISESELRTSRFRHVVTNSVGIKPLQYVPELQTVPLKPADRLILVTDGATDSLDDEAIRAAGKFGCPNEAADTLVLEALRHGSRDNISCVVVKVVPESVHWHREA